MGSPRSSWHTSCMVVCPRLHRPSGPPTDYPTHSPFANSRPVVLARQSVSGGAYPLCLFFCVPLAARTFGAPSRRADHRMGLANLPPGRFQRQGLHFLSINLNAMPAVRSSCLRTRSTLPLPPRYSQVLTLTLLSLG